MEQKNATNTNVCPDLYIDQCEVMEVQVIETGKVELEDIFKDETAMTDSTNEKYLGDIISSNGSSAKNIEARQNKGKGIVSQVMTISVLEIFSLKWLSS